MAYSSLLGLLLPDTGSLSGTWGTAVNDQITSLIDSAISGSTTLSTDADVTLTDTQGVANQSRQAILLCTGSRTVTRNITAPARSKAYIVVNATSGGQAVVIRGAGPTTGVSIANGTRALVAWTGADFSVVAASAVDVSAITGLGSNVAAFLATPSSANLAAAVTGETGSGALVFGTSPSIGDATFTDGYTEETVTANSSTAYTIVFTNGTVQFITMTGNCTFTFPTPTAGKSFSLFLKQDGTGSRTATWPGTVLWPYGINPTLTTTINKTDRFVFTADGTNWFGSVAGQSY